jgi:hypothetical protein
MEHLGLNTADRDVENETPEPGHKVSESSMQTESNDVGNSTPEPELDLYESDLYFEE